MPHLTDGFPVFFNLLHTYYVQALCQLRPQIESRLVSYLVWAHLLWSQNYPFLGPSPPISLQAFQRQGSGSQDAQARQ